VLKQIRPEKQGMQLGPEEGKILQILIKLANVKTVIEIGTYVGYSTIWIARALPENGHVTAIEKNADSAAQAQANFKNAGLDQKITLKQGEAHTILANLNIQPDMVFIDADKGGYMDYLHWADTNLRPGGLLVADNTFLFGSVYEDSPPENISKNSWKVMRAFNQNVAKNYDSIMLPTEEGMVVARKR